jgi:hypothetical protein
LRLRRLVQRTGVALLLAWLAFGLAQELRQAVRDHVLRPPSPHAELPWRYGTPPVRRLQRFLRRATRGIPADEPLGFASAAGARRNPEFFRYLWASYLLPERVVMPAPDAVATGRARYLVAYGIRLDHPALKLVWEDPGGAVYRIRRGGAPAEAPPAGAPR